MKGIQGRIGVDGIKAGLAERVGVLFARVMEVGKVLPRVVSGLVISGCMRVVSAGDSIGKGVLIALTIIWIGMGFIVGGSILCLIGHKFYGCNRQDRITEMVTHGLDINVYRRGYCLVRVGRLTLVTGSVIFGVGILILAGLEQK